MPRAHLCKDCWELTTEYSLRQKTSQKNPAQPGAATCDLCRLLRDSILAFRDLGDKPELQGADWTLPKQKLTLYHPSRYPMCGVNVTFSKPVHKSGDWVEGKDVKRQKSIKIVRKSELEITTPFGEHLPWGGFANATSISKYSGSEECSARIDEWLGECLTDHKICNERSPGCTDMEGPKRVIDTGPLDGDLALKLIDYPGSEENLVKYCALSYSWGKEEENFKTTRETYDSRRRGIRLEELPWMFRDAVAISRRVGCRYLWIDAICIIQQDREDWEIEAHRMYSIYGNAYLVIAASHSPSPSSSIFATRPPIARFNFNCAGKTFKISVKERVDHDIWQARERYDFRTVPLHSRAWAFQERLLARRVIHYGPSELVWECKKYIRCECSGIQWPVQSLDYKPGRSLKSEVAESLVVAGAPKHAKRAWHSIVTQYTARQLTVGSDRLPALSGLAKQFAFPQMGRYLAGIWYSQLPDALGWTISGARKPKKYRAPSWCWSSLDGPIHYVTHGCAKEVHLIEANCTPAGDDPYGEVSDGYIIVKGEFGPVNKAGHRADDYDMPVSEEEDVWALKMDFSDWNIWYSLLLKRSRRVEGAWERCGIGIRCLLCREREDGNSHCIALIPGAFFGID